MDRGVWWATVHGAAKSQMQLSTWVNPSRWRLTSLSTPASTLSSYHPLQALRCHRLPRYSRRREARRLRGHSKRPCCTLCLNCYTSNAHAAGGGHPPRLSAQVCSDATLTAPFKVPPLRIPRPHPLSFLASFFPQYFYYLVVFSPSVVSDSLQPHGL